MKRLKIHNKSEHPTHVKGEQFSVDVITCDKSGLINLGFYNYDMEKWSFHTDTLQNYDNVEFVWIYAPKGLIQKAKSINEEQNENI